MLVRRDVWDELGGLDPALPLLRDDVDLGWRANLAGHRVAVVTDAVVHHVEAGTRGSRPLDAGGLRRHRLDRQHATYVLLANLPLVLLPVAVVTLVAGGLSGRAATCSGSAPATPSTRPRRWWRCWAGPPGWRGPVATAAGPVGSRHAACSGSSLREAPGPGTPSRPSAC